MKILVAGGTGFLGLHVVNRLKKENLPFITASLSQGIDFRNYKQTEKFFKENKIDTVIYCAAFVGGISYGYEKPAESYCNNILMATNLIELSRIYKVKRFINPISNCSYPGHLTKKLKEELWWDGPLHESVLAYGIARKASWVQTWAYNKQYGMDFINLILPNMYGPSDHFDEKKSHVIGALIMKMCDAKAEGRKDVIVWGSGKPIREWLYVKDAVTVILKSISITPTIEPINIGIGEGISVRALAELIKDIAGYKGRLVYDPTKPDGAPYKIMDNKRMIKHFMGWIPPTKLRDGIEETVEWYLNNKKRA